VLEQAFDENSVRRYVQAVKAVLDHERLGGPLERAARHIPGDAPPLEKVRAAMPGPGPADQSSGGTEHPAVPYLSRNPLISLVQSVVEESLRERATIASKPVHADLWHTVVHTVERLLHPGRFTPEDPNWVIKIAEAVLEHFAKGNHPFNPVPAQHAISDTARLVIVGDWGTGLPRAQAVGRLMAGSVTQARAAGREAHVIHLGDIYYSGLPGEDRRHALDIWPVTVEQALAGVTSWSLNGNHDMYSGAYGYFQTLLADPRFARQHSPDGAATSFFRLSSPSWNFIGLDTAWSHRVLTTGAVAVLEPPQAQFVASVTAETPSRKTVLFSHHQLTSVWDKGDLGPELTEKLRPVLDGNKITAWWWGHEHRSMAFEPTSGVQFPRCLGHGGVPVLQSRTPEDPVPRPGIWEDRAAFEDGDQRWARFGYAVLDLDGPSMTVTYIDDNGEQVRSEEIS
jgi:hypothetical protein